ncbi:7-carboxy-7-deazaguanine synthase [Aminobacter phage Erebus]|nr:7-carboxy-7-deazaguanine synthase [Aminobacter phage Erebus]
MNTQKPEGPRRSDGTTIDFHSMFFTIQGEGPFAGHRSIFIRLAGCNLQCPGCDTEYTAGRNVLSTGALVDKVWALVESNNFFGSTRPLIVLTGGEPLRQPVGPLVKLLLDLDFKVQIESNGFFPMDSDLTELFWDSRSRDFVSLVISPKTAKINSDTALVASAFKYVLDAESIAHDGLPMQALSHPTGGKAVARPPAGWRGPIYLNPFDAGDADRNKRNLAAVVDSCMKHGYILGVQLHKLVGLE